MTITLKEMAEFANRDFMHEQAVRQWLAVKEAIDNGVFPVRVGSMIVNGPNSITLSRRRPIFDKTGDKT